MQICDTVFLEPFDTVLSSSFCLELKASIYAEQNDITMTPDKTPFTTSEVRIPKTRSFPNLVASLLFNHSSRSSMANDHDPHTSNRMLTTDDDLQSISSASISVFGFLGSPFEQDSFNWVDPDTIIHKASSSSSSTSMRRSETWTTSFQRPNDLTQNASLPKSETSAGSGNLSISATGSSSVRALQRSLSDLFAPNKVVIDAHEETTQETREVTNSRSPSVSKICPSLSQSSALQVSTPSSPDVSMATPLAVHPAQPHSKATLRRQWSLVAVPESDPRRESQQSGVDPNADGHHSKAMTSRPDASESTYVDENDNIAEPVVLDSRQRHRSSEGALEMAPREKTSHGHVMQVPQAVYGGSSRRLGIMELLGAGEKKNVRNKDVNMMAPQSW